MKIKRKEKENALLDILHIGKRVQRIMGVGEIGIPISQRPWGCLQLPWRLDWIIGFFTEMGFVYCKAESVFLPTQSIHWSLARFLKPHFFQAVQFSTSHMRMVTFVFSDVKSLDGTNITTPFLHTFCYPSV